MNDAFLEVLHRQYHEQIIACIKASTHQHKTQNTKVVDYTGLMEKLFTVYESARVEGISESQFREWIDQAFLLDHTPVQFKYVPKKAA